MKYVIMLAEEISTINFSQVLETSEETLRYSLNRNNVLLKRFVTRRIKEVILCGVD